MAHITLSGILLDPTGEFAVGDKIRFTHKSTTGSTVKSAVSWLTVPPDGSYSIDLEYGLVLVEYNDYKRGSYANLGVATVNQDNLATTIPELLNAVVPASDAVILEMQAILADTLSQATIATEQATIATEQATLISNSALEIKTPTKADFFAQAEKRIRDNAGSGFSEWGKHFASTATQEHINEGLWQDLASAAHANSLKIGVDQSLSGIATGAVSRTNYPITQVNGVTQVLNQINTYNINKPNHIIFPPAPDGTKTYDSATGSVVEHASAAIAFAAETTTNKVITSRQDFTFLESFHEKISDKDVVYPLGNVQYGASSWEGVTLSNTVEAQGYSAFGEWDTSTKGYGVVWSTLSDANKAKFLQDPENNIYNDDGELVQVRYRVRVVEGLGDEWANVNTQSTAPFLWYAGTTRVKAVGSGNVGDFTSSTNNSFAGTNAITSSGFEHATTGLFAARSNNTIAHNGLCFAVPIALVQRRNQGAYHPAFNSEGTGKFWYESGASSSAHWYDSTAKKATNTAQCFDFGSTPNAGNSSPFTYTSWGGISAGTAQAGRPDDKFFDAIYASDVQDLRMSSKRLPLTEIREKYKRMGIAGDVRGFESVPFTKPEPFVTSIVTYSSGRTLLFSTLIDLTTNGAYDGKVIGHVIGDSGTVYEVDQVAVSTTSIIWLSDKYGNVASDFTTALTYILLNELPQTHKQASPAWTDIIGDPANIAATFPNGVEGQWIPVIPDGTSKEYKLNRKQSTRLSSLFNPNSGASWFVSSLPVSTTSNSYNTTESAAQIRLYIYETQSHFTADDVNSEVLDLGGVFGTSKFTLSQGGALANSLSGGVLVGNSGGLQVDYKSVEGGIHPTTNLLSGDTWRGYPAHNTIPLAIPSNGGSAVKTLDYLSSENGVAKLMYAYKEMVYDSSADNSAEFISVSGTTYTSYTAGNYYKITGLDTNILVKALVNFGFSFALTSKIQGGYGYPDGILVFELWDGNGWGDNNQFEITNNQATQTDDNGNTVKYGTASFNTQYFTVEE